MGLFSFLKPYDIAIDVGASKVRIWTSDRGMVVDVPNVIAMMRGRVRNHPEIVAFGTQATLLAGRGDSETVVMGLKRNGTIGDARMMGHLLRYLLNGYRPFRFRRSRAIVGVPSTANFVEARILRDSARHAGITDVALIHEGLAVSTSEHGSLTKASAVAIVDIGTHSTRTTIHVNGRIVHKRAYPVGGIDVDQAISEHLRRQHHLIIREYMAEALKIRLCRFLQDESDAELEISGVQAADGFPTSVRLSSMEFSSAISETRARLVAAVRASLASMSPELGADVSANDILLCGGGALLPFMDVSLEASLDKSVRLVHDPLTAQVRGAAMALARTPLHQDPFGAYIPPDEPNRVNWAAGNATGGEVHFAGTRPIKSVRGTVPSGLLQRRPNAIRQPPHPVHVQNREAIQDIQLISNG